MKKKIDSILIVNNYLLSQKNCKNRTSIARTYLKDKLDKALKSKNPTFSLEIFNLPLNLFSI